MKTSRLTSIFAKPILICVFYGIVAKLSLTLLLTVITTVALMAGHPKHELVNNINDIHNNYAFLASGAGAILALTILWLGDRALMLKNYFWNLPGRKVWQLSLMAKNELSRGAGTALLMSAFLVLVLWVSRQINFLGLFFDSNTTPMSYVTFLINIFGLIALSLGEEYIFRHKILSHLVQKIRAIPAIIITAACYIAVKRIQVDLSITDTINLLLLNLVLGLYFVNNGYTLYRSFSFVAMLYLVISPVTGLPLWQRTGPSFLLFRDVTTSSTLLTGGPAGPMNSLITTVLLLLLAVSQYMSWQSKYARQQ